MGRRVCVETIREASSEENARVLRRKEKIFSFNAVVSCAKSPLS